MFVYYRGPKPLGFPKYYTLSPFFSLNPIHMHDFHYDLYPDGSRIFIPSPDFHLQVQVQLSKYLRDISAH